MSGTSSRRASGASASADPFAELPALDDVDAMQEFQHDGAVQNALAKGTDLRQYATEVESALRAVERESVADYIKESEGLAGLHRQIRECDGVLDGMESVLRGFQSDLSSISAQIKSLQAESLTMNVKLRNRKAAECQLSAFITQVVVRPELISAICESEVNEAYLEYVLELNKKVAFSKQESTARTSACADIAPELEKLEQKAVQKIRDFMLSRVGSLRKKMTNVQILQQSVLLKYKGLFRFLQEHAPAGAIEVREAYTSTMGAIYLRHLKMYLGGLMRLRVEGASKGDLLGTEEWSSFSPSALFSAKPATARSDGAFRLGDRAAALDGSEAPPLPAHLQQQGTPIHYEAIYRAVSTVLLDSVSCEYDFMTEFFGSAESFDAVFGKAIFHCMENIEQTLAGSWDAIGCLLLLQVRHARAAARPPSTAHFSLASTWRQVNSEQRAVMSASQLPPLSTFFQRVQARAWTTRGHVRTAQRVPVPSPGARVGPV